MTETINDIGTNDVEKDGTIIGTNDNMEKDIGIIIGTNNNVETKDIGTINYIGTNNKKNIKKEKKNVRYTFEAHICENIRKKWDTIEDKSPEIYDLLWDDWFKKFNVDRIERCVRLLKNFIMNNTETIKNPIDGCSIEMQDDNNTMLLKGLQNRSKRSKRKMLYSICTNMGLHYKITTNPKNKKSMFLYIYKPKIWLWEYTVPNPYIVAVESHVIRSPKYYEQRREQAQEKKEKKKQWLHNKYCSNCDATGDEVQLYNSVYISGLHCEDCLEYESDGEGGVMGDHKFEPIEYYHRY
jgi:hypothetical protein